MATPAAQLGEEAAHAQKAPPPERVAATVVLLRDGASGPEVLMLERPHDRGSFAGAWVFPGGSVDVDDGLVTAPENEPHPGEETAARHAAVREVREETALSLQENALELVSCWSPPPTVPRRFRTWFYYAAAPDGEIALSPQESVDHRWIRPADALAAQAVGTLALVPPTWVTLHALVHERTVAAALERAAHGETDVFNTRLLSLNDGRVFLWAEDVAYADAAQFDANGARHRLDTRSAPWAYTRSVPGVGAIAPGEKCTNR